MTHFQLDLWSPGADFSPVETFNLFSLRRQIDSDLTIIIFIIKIKERDNTILNNSKRSFY